MKNFLFFQLPSCGPNSFNIEPLRYHELTNIPITVSIDKQKYVAFGAIVFIPPFMENDIGHYVAVVKINNTWEVFDDTKEKSRTISSTKKIVVTNLFYIKKN